MYVAPDLRRRVQFLPTYPPPSINKPALSPPPPILPSAHSLQMQLCPTNRSLDIMSARQPARPPARPARRECVQRQEGWALRLCRHAATPDA